MCIDARIINRHAVSSCFLLWHENPTPGPFNPILGLASTNRGTEVNLVSLTGLPGLISSQCSKWLSRNSFANCTDRGLDKNLSPTQSSLTTSIEQISMMNCPDAHVAPSFVISVSLAVSFLSAFEE